MNITNIELVHNTEGKATRHECLEFIKKFGFEPYTTAPEDQLAFTDGKRIFACWPVDDKFTFDWQVRNKELAPIISY